MGKLLMTSNNRLILEACNAIGDGKISEAKQLIKVKYPFTPLKKTGRNYSNFQKTEIFLRDGFVDRYSGEQMVFPPVLRLLSRLMPDELPFQKNWKMSECHLAYWQLLPTVDHIVPVSRGGEDKSSNWVCTSQLRNSAKSIWLLDELGWQLHEPGDLTEWDGLLKWYLTYMGNNSAMLDESYMRSWHSAALRALGT